MGPGCPTSGTGVSGKLWWLLREWALVWALVLALVPGAAAAQGAPAADLGLRLRPQTTQVDLGPHLRRWVDPGAQADWAQARQRLAEGAFQPVGHLDSAGYTRAAHWFAFDLARDAGAGERWVLALGAPYLDDIQVWVQTPDGRVRTVRMGDRHLHEGRPLQGRQHAMDLLLDEETGVGALHRVWIRVRSSGAMNVTAELWRPAAYFDHEIRLAAAWGVVVGLLALAALVQLFLGLWLRDAVMLAFAGYVGVLGLLYFGISGLALVAWTQPPSWYDDLLVGSASLAMLAVASYGSMKVLEIDRHLPRWRWFYLAPALASLVALPVSVSDAYGKVVALGNLWGIVLSVVNIGVSCWLWWRLGGRMRALNTLATVILGLGATGHVIMLLGGLPANAYTRQVYSVASIVYLLLTLTAMAVRVGWLRQDKLLAQRRVAEERRFAAFVAHEFRNPLAGIDRSANLLQVVPDLDGEQIAQRLGGIRRQVARLNTLIDGFLLADGRNTRPLEPRPEVLALEPWLRDLHQALDPEAQARLQVWVETPGLQARLDARLVRLALHNLIDNALRYSPEDRPVCLQAQRSADGAGLALVVGDQGPGLSAEDLALLGRPYHRGAAAIGHQGSGLGYHFTRQIAELHGGDVQARNAEPQGLVVTLFLPGVVIRA